MYQRSVLICLLFAGCGVAVQAQALTCTNSQLTGTYFYLLNGSLLQGGPYAELGLLVADGQGHVSGQSRASTNGTLATYSLSGTYQVQANCRGNMALTVNSSFVSLFNFEMVGGGDSALVAFSSAGGVLVGRAYRATAGATQCGNGSLTGNYGFLLSGVAGGLLYSEEGQVVSDGNGNLNVTAVQNSNGTVSTLPPGSGAYSLTGNCSGTAFVTNQFGTANYLFAVVQNGQSVLFLETDAGATVAGTAQSQNAVSSVLPDFAFGGGFYSAIYFTNTGNSAVSFPVTFTGDDVAVLGLRFSGPNGAVFTSIPTVGR